MWYEQLLERLIVSKVQDTEQKQAIEFLHLIFTKCCEVSRKPVPPLALLGIIDKLYKKFASQKDGTIELKTFARELTGLSLVFVKASFDSAVWNSDWHLEQDAKIKAALGFDGPDIASQPKEVSSDKKFLLDEWGDTELPTDIEQVSGINSKINYLEIMTLRTWNYDVSLDLDHVLSVLIANRTVVVPQIFEYFKFFAGKSEDFDQFICKFWLMHLAHEYIEKGDLHLFQELFNGETDALAGIIGIKEFPENITQRFFRKIINEFLHNPENKDALLKKAIQLNQPKIASFLSNVVISSPVRVTETNLQTSETLNSHGAKTPLVLIVTQITGLIKKRDQWMRANPDRMIGFRLWEHANERLIRQITDQISYEESAAIKWHSISAKELCFLCKAHYIKLLSGLDASEFDISTMDENNSLTPLQNSLSEGCEPKTDASKLAAIGMFSQPVVLRPTNLQSSFIRGFEGFDL